MVAVGRRAELRTLAFAGQTALIMALTGSSTLAANATGSVTVTTTLVDRFAHLVPSSVLDVILGGVKVVATDTSGDQVADGTVTVNIVDDAPTLNIVDTPSSVNETQTINGTCGPRGRCRWRDVGRCDGRRQYLDAFPGVAVKHSRVQSFDGHLLTVDADYEWHFTANSVTSNQ